MANDQINSLIEGPREIHLNSGQSITIRPFTFGSFGLCKKLGLTMFGGGAEDEFDDSGNIVEKPESDELSDDVMWQLQVFFWMQSQPIADVLAAVRKDTWRERVEEFGFDLPIHTMKDLMGEMNRISAMAQEAAVDVAPKSDSGESDKGAPGN